MSFLKKLRDELNTQKNGGSPFPLWTIQVKRRRFGIDPGFNDPHGWILDAGDGDVAAEIGGGGMIEILDDEEIAIGEATMAAAYHSSGLIVADRYGSGPRAPWRPADAPDGWSWLPFVEEWQTEPGQVALTQKGAQRLLRCNYDGEARLFVASMHASPEMRELLEVLRADP
jgi:hypothetical protein